MKRKIARFLNWIDPDYDDINRFNRIRDIDQQIREYERAIEDLRMQRQKLLDDVIVGNIRKSGW